jgi:hypothetical protein
MNPLVIMATSVGLPIKTKTLIALAFSLVIALVCVASFVALAVAKIRQPDADVSVFLNVFLTTLGYVGGALTGLLGLKD